MAASSRRRDVPLHEQAHRAARDDDAPLNVQVADAAAVPTAAAADCARRRPTAASSSAAERCPWPPARKHCPVKMLCLLLTIKTMGETITPGELAKELGVSDRAVRQWLRDQGWQAVPYARWHLTEEQAAQVRAHFRR